MYLPVEEIEKESLRQGDIISNILCIGALNLNALIYHVDMNEKIIGWSVNKKPDFLDCMVLSHSCEIAKENGIKVTSIILAPLRAINSVTRENKIQDIIESNIIKEGTIATYLKYFYLIPDDRLSIKDGAVVDFSKCFSVRNQSYNKLLENKAIQLNNKTVQSMALKLAIYYHRNQQAVQTDQSPGSI